MLNMCSGLGFCRYHRAGRSRHRDVSKTLVENGL